MKQLIEKLWSIHRELSASDGPFVLFGLFEREDSAGRWDLVVSAEWLRVKRRHGRLFQELQRELGPELIVLLSHVAVLEPDDTFIKALEEQLRLANGRDPGNGETLHVGDLAGRLPLGELRDCTLNGMSFRRVILYEFNPAPDRTVSAVA